MLQFLKFNEQLTNKLEIIKNNLFLNKYCAVTFILQFYFELLLLCAQLKLPAQPKFGFRLPDRCNRVGNVKDVNKVITAISFDID